MSAESVRRLKNRKTNTSLGIPHTFSFPLLPTHECRAVNLHMMTLKILFHMDVKWRYRKVEPSTDLDLDGFGVQSGPATVVRFLFLGDHVHPSDELSKPRSACLPPI